MSPSTDEHELRNQRISTWLFIILFTTGMIILLLYNSLINTTKTVNIETPTLQQYEHLYSTYSQTLNCPCEKISINYDKFLHIKYQLHQVCYSDFVGEKWIRHLTKSEEKPNYSVDFRTTSSLVFQGLKMFCELSNSTISDNLIRFHSQQYISATVISLKLFESDIDSLTKQFRSSMENDFLLSRLMIRDTTQANALLSAKQTNYDMVMPTFFTPLAKKYGGCECGSLSTCVEPSFIISANGVPYFYIPGFYSGCYVIESLLQSTLQCFYSEQCIKNLQIHYTPPLIVVRTLDSSLSSNYRINSTVQQFVDKLMIDVWSASSVYEKYYNECKPTRCTYRYETRNDIIYIFTTLFGIAGGLITTLGFIVPHSISFIRKIIRKPNRRIAPDISIVEL